MCKNGIIYLNLLHLFNSQSLLHTISFLYQNVNFIFFRKKITRKCWCDWPECDEFHEKLKSLAPKDDVWNQDIKRFRFGESLSKLTVNSAMP